MTLAQLVDHQREQRLVSPLPESRVSSVRISAVGSRSDPCGFCDLLRRCRFVAFDRGRRRPGGGDGHGARPGHERCGPHPYGGQLTRTVVPSEPEFATRVPGLALRRPEELTRTLSNLPVTTPLPVLVRTEQLRRRTEGLRRRIEDDYREMEQALGLAHFEGRTWPSRHHVTLVSVAHAFCTLQRLNRSPKETAPACTESSASCRHSLRPGPAPAPHVTATCQTPHQHDQALPGRIRTA